MRVLKIKAAKAVSLLWLGSLLGAGLAFLTQIMLARVLGVTDFGIFSSAFAVVTLLAPLAGFGVAPFWLKAFGQEGWEARRWWKGSLQFTTLSTSLVMMTLAAWAIWGPHDATMSQAILILSLYIPSHLLTELLTSRFQLEERYGALALWHIAPHFVRFASILLATHYYPSGQLSSIALIYSIISILVSAAALYSLKSLHHETFSLKGHGAKLSFATLEAPSFLNVFKESWPFGLAGLFYLIYFQSSIILLKYLDDADAAGLYNIALVIVSAVYLFPAVLYQKFLLPKIHRWAHHNETLLSESYIKGNIFMLSLGIAAALIIWTSSSWGILFLFGKELPEASQALRILAFAIPFRFVATSVGAVLATRDNMRRKIVCMGTVAAFSISSNIVLIPIYGIIGAAITTILGDALLLAMYYRSVKKYVFPS